MVGYLFSFIFIFLLEIPPSILHYPTEVSTFGYPTDWCYVELVLLNIFQTLVIWYRVIFSRRGFENSIFALRCFLQNRFFLSNISKKTSQYLKSLTKQAFLRYFSKLNKKIQILKPEPNKTRCLIFIIVLGVTCRICSQVRT